MQYLSFLEHGRYAYLKLSALLVAVAAVAYAWHEPDGGRHGGTWLGYTLGAVSALIVVALLWFGVRKRQYRSAPGTLKGWLSAHVYLGLALVAIATLHAAFELGWNLHSLLYLLMLLVVASGFYGVYAYLRFPRLVTQNLGEDTLETLFLKIADIDHEARRVALQLPDEINGLVQASVQGTRVGGGVMRQLSGRDPRCPTMFALQRLEQPMEGLDGEQARRNRELYALVLRKASLLQRAREDVMYRARLQFWLYFHVPLAIAMLAALVAHVVSVFFYW